MQRRKRKQPILTEGTVILTEVEHVEANTQRRKIEKCKKSRLSAEE